MFWRRRKSTEMIICNSGCFHKINFLSKKTSRFPRQLRPSGWVTHRRPSRHRHTHMSPPNTFKTFFIEKVNNFPVNRKFLQAEVWKFTSVCINNHHLFQYIVLFIVNLVCSHHLGIAENCHNVHDYYEHFLYRHFFQSHRRIRLCIFLCLNTDIVPEDIFSSLIC